MVVSINPTIPVIAAPSVGTATDALVLPQGAVVTAKVQAVLANDRVQIAIGNLTLEVATEVPLQAGQTLQLAMAQSDQGTVRLAIVNPDQVAQGQASQGQAAQGGQATQNQTTQVQVAQGQAATVSVPLDDIAETPAVIVSPALANMAAPQQSDPLTPMQRMAVSVATEQAVMQQASQGQLFADLNAVVSSPDLPPALRTAISQVLAQQTPLSSDLTGADIRNAQQSSGLVLEASLAAVAASPMAAATVAAAPSSDLKAALIVLRQVLGQVLGTASQTSDGAPPTTTPGATPAPTPFKPYSPPPPVSTPQLLLPSPQSILSQQLSSPQQTPSPQQPFAASPQGSSQSAASPQQTASAPQPATSQSSSPPQTSSQPTTSQPASSRPASMPSPSLVPDEIEAEPMPEGGQQSTPLPQGRTAAFESTLRTGTAGDGLAEMLAKASPRSLTPTNILDMLQGKGASSRTAGFGAQTRISTADGQSEEVVVRTNLPPPPYRGSLPSAQAMASPLLSADTPLSKIVRRLLSDTDAALSRQTLLQVASLPDRPDAPGARLDPTAPRWNFEIPFATQQGTAMAQFEISRDSDASTPDPAKRVWRARFSLDVEPAGPVHALVSLIGERASVRMWAERPYTARQLRGGAGDLVQALAQAALTPGDIVVHDGAPPAVALPKAGHFLDRAT